MRITYHAASGRSSCRPLFMTRRHTVSLGEAGLRGQADDDTEGLYAVSNRSLY
jgi:hypothetical protein